jgi:uncharacterized repeat protein (TIGR03803 family)
MKVSAPFRKHLLQESSVTKLGAFTRAFLWSGLLFLLLALMADSAGAQSFKVLHTFKGSPADGSDPVARLVLDPGGTLYGTTAQGGLYGYGTVFKLNRNGQETLLHNFNTETLDGFSPLASLVRAPNGNLYGSTSLGGDGTAHGAGTVFMLDPAGNETILYAFTNGTDGGDPLSDVVRDKNGNLYGTTFDTNRSSPAGVVFKLTASARAPWKETVLHTFTNIPDGAGPIGGLIMDTRGNFYGTTSVGVRMRRSVRDRQER